MKILYILIITALISCNKFNKAEVIYYKVTDGFSSGSGMDYWNGEIFACGDDSPYLFKLNDSGRIVNQIPIHSLEGLKNGRLEKKTKPDFEAVTNFNYKLDSGLLIFASGSTLHRNQLVKVNFENDSIVLNNYSLANFYKAIQKKHEISADDFNIEGAAFWNNKLILLNRGDNSLFSINIDHFFHFISSNDTLIDMKRYKYNLPNINGNQATFSGATIKPNSDDLIFTATVELTDDWKGDGKILGSFIGALDLNDLDKDPIYCIKITENNIGFKGKVESLIWDEQKKDNDSQIIAITDNDNGSTEFLKIKIW